MESSIRFSFTINSVEFHYITVSAGEKWQQVGMINQSSSLGPEQLKR